MILSLPFDLSRFGDLVSNFIENPHGSDRLSIVDDAIRETREHIVDCMRKISGYPNVDTIAVKVWDNSSRPEGFTNDDNRLLLGYNSDINALEVVTKEGSAVNAIALLAYPVGSYYETSDPDFNPNTAWGGTWNKVDSAGRVLVATGTRTNGTHTFSLNETGGEETHALTRPELPIHYHPHRHPHSHNITETVTNNNETTEVAKKYVVTTSGTPDGYIPSAAASAGTNPIGIKLVNETGLPYKEDYAYSMKQVSNADEGWFALGDPTYTLHGMVDADTPNPIGSRVVSEDLLMHVGSAVGQNGHNNLQPYKVCVRWHRTA